LYIYEISVKALEFFATLLDIGTVRSCFKQSCSSKSRSYVCMDNSEVEQNTFGNVKQRINLKNY